MANQPDFIPSAWAANNSTTETIPATTTESGKASWDQGFPVETSLPLSQGGVPPKYGDFNGILNILSQFALFAQSGGHFTWNATQDYSVGSIVLGSDGSLYRAAQVSGPSSTVVNPVGDTSGAWERVVSQSDIAALQEDIQNAMDTAADAASNASVAQSAVTTLDANVVKLSGAQTVGGTKTYTGSAVFSGGMTVSSGATIDSATVTSGATISGGATISSGITADTLTVTNGATISGGMTVDGKGLVYTSGDQDIAGLKYYTNNFYQKNTNYDITVTPSTAQYNGLGFSDKNDIAFASITTFQNTNDSRGMMFRIRAKNESSVTSFMQGSKDASGNIIIVCYGTTRPNATNSETLGDATYRWKQLYANTSTINTSDERSKDNITLVSDAVLDAWGEVSWSQFQFKDAIAEKGEDKARLHNGLVAQRIDEAFKAHGLDASRYGLFCHDVWDAVQEEKDENGNVIQEAVEAGDAYSLRYEEALAMEAAYQRRRADRAEARITALEQRLNEIAPISDEQTEPQESEGAE